MIVQGVRVNVGGHNIEITPDESGRRKQFSVRANDLEVDVNDKSYTLPEGREKFHVIKSVIFHLFGLWSGL